MPGNKRYGDLPAAHHRSLIGIFASEAENCPNALLEAMAAGKPILCSSRPPMPEFGGKAVWYFDPSSVEDLSGKLLRLLREPATRERLGAAAAEWSRRFDWDQTARATWSALRKLEQSGQPLIVHAPNVHVGGGRELLAALKKQLDLTSIYGLLFLSDDPHVRSESPAKSLVAYVGSLKQIRVMMVELARRLVRPVVSQAFVELVRIWH